MACGAKSPKAIFPAWPLTALKLHASDGQHTSHECEDGINDNGLAPKNMIREDFIDISKRRGGLKITRLNYLLCQRVLSAENLSAIVENGGRKR